MPGNLQLDLTVERAEELIRLMTDGLVNIKDESGEFLEKLDSGFVVNSKTWEGWEWTHGVALTALAHHSSLSPSSPSAQYSQKTALEWFETQYTLTGGRGAPKNINTMAPFYCLAEMISQGRTDPADARWIGWCNEWAEWIMSPEGLPKTEEGGFQHVTLSATHEQQLWDDTLMMTAIPLTRIGILLNRPEYISAAKYQFLLHIQYLVDTSTGLWFHGWQFTPGSTPGSTSSTPGGGRGHNFAKALWARGNSWITVAIPLFLEILGDRLARDDPVRLVLVSTFKRQVDALLPLQDPQTGLWHTLLVDQTSYVESSASAGFAAGIFAGLRMGLITGEKYGATARTALAGVIAQINPKGEVENCSFGTPMGDSFQFYKDIAITPMPYGQALVMLALVEWERLEGGK